MNTYRINWSVTVRGTHYSGTVEPMDRNMNANMARHYALADLHDHYGTMAVNVNDIQVSWQ